MPESLTDYQSNEGRSACAVEFPDGRMRIERTKQIIPNEPATQVFTTKLNSTQSSELLSILSKTEKLSAFTPPKMPFIADSAQYFEVEIVQNQRLREIGYFKWRGNTPAEASPASMPDNVKKAWQISEAALQPLVQWFHNVQSIKMQLSKMAPTQCKIYSKHQRR